jgi:hypothetical protein
MLIKRWTHTVKMGGKEPLIKALKRWVESTGQQGRVYTYQHDWNLVSAELEFESEEAEAQFDADYDYSQPAWTEGVEAVGEFTLHLIRDRLTVQ